MKETIVLTDEVVVRSVLRGDAEAYGLLVERHRARLFALAFHLTGDYDAASDLAQDALVAAYGALDRLRDPSAFAPWTAGILRNKFRNLGRGRPARTLSLDQMMDAGFDPPHEAGDPRPGEEELRQVMRCVEALPPKYRETLLLRYSQDLSYKQIAETLDLPVTTITTRLNKARRLLVKQAKKIGLL